MTMTTLVEDYYGFIQQYVGGGDPYITLASFDAKTIEKVRKWIRSEYKKHKEATGWFISYHTVTNCYLDGEDVVTESWDTVESDGNSDG